MKASVAIQVLPKADNDQELVRIVDEVIAYIYPDAQAKDASEHGPALLRRSL